MTLVAKMQHPGASICRPGRRAPLDPVLDRLDVVIGLGLDRLDLGTVGRCEGPNQGAQALDRRRRNG
ncbi:MAG TPA: hypothetical protein VM528_01620, partial [Burkholderiaceae bacterium]|nr:hypothetical protein [Burkholderiaceae bacterium]